VSGDPHGQGSRGAEKGGDVAGGVIETVRVPVLAEGHVPVAMHELDAPVTAVQEQDELPVGRGRLPVIQTVFSFFFIHRRAMHPITGHSLRMSSPGTSAAGTTMWRRSIRPWQGCGDSLHLARGNTGSPKVPELPEGRAATEAERRHHPPAADGHGQQHQSRQGVKRVQPTLATPWIGNLPHCGSNRNPAREPQLTNFTDSDSGFSHVFKAFIGGFNKWHWPSLQLV